MNFFRFITTAIKSTHSGAVIAGSDSGNISAWTEIAGDLKFPSFRSNSLSDPGHDAPISALTPISKSRIASLDQIGRICFWSIRSCDDFHQTVSGGDAPSVQVKRIPDGAVELVLEQAISVSSGGGQLAYSKFSGNLYSVHDMVDIVKVTFAGFVKMDLRTEGSWVGRAYDDNDLLPGIIVRIASDEGVIAVAYLDGRLACYSEETGMEISNFRLPDDCVVREMKIHSASIHVLNEDGKARSFEIFGLASGKDEFFSDSPGLSSFGMEDAGCCLNRISLAGFVASRLKFPGSTRRFTGY